MLAGYVTFSRTVASDPGRAGGVKMAAALGDEGGRALPGAPAAFGGGHVEYCTGAGASGRAGGVEEVVGAYLSGARRFLRSWGMASLRHFGAGGVRDRG